MVTQETINKYKHYQIVHSETGQHFNTFYHYGKKCKRIVEFGVDRAYSAWAWVSCEPEYLRCVDIRRHIGDHAQVETEATTAGIDYQFVIGDVGHGSLIEIEKKFNRVSYGADEVRVTPYNLDADVELLYIDTYHSYTQLKAELSIHGHQVKKYMLFHDTADTAFGLHSHYDGDIGLNPAIDEFLAANPNWKYLNRTTYSYGMTVLGNMDNVDDIPNMDPNLKFPDPDWITR